MSIFIRVAAPYSLARCFLTPLLGEFCDWQPGMTAELIVSDDMADIVEQRIDIAARTGNLPDSGLIARRRRICATPSAGVTCATVEGGCRSTFFRPGQGGSTEERACVGRSPIRGTGGSKRQG
ncbi:LysR substrate-binding domain-containing protein [Burkholderia contaminans]|uniref:LysR substrate-binding domain-containing protein n=1 Tax=Burkholderia contaminans TaxID=488447 RepID=UPI001CF2DB04|nr:LysR substrate-binding domain-containing protein [Burkholderia contaminans]MCA8157475.1 hypothetical protein [Burkholderia contaminans]